MCKQESADFVWVLDPIDGTKSFNLCDMINILSIIDQPILRKRWIGVHGRRTILNGQKISTRNCSQIAKAYMYTTRPHLFREDTEVVVARVRNKVKVPLYGCDCYAYALLSSGHVDLVIEAGLKTRTQILPCGCNMNLHSEKGSLPMDWCLTYLQLYDFFALIPVIGKDILNLTR